MIRSDGRSIRALVLVALVIQGCIGAQRAQPPPDDQFGHRYGDDADGARRTIVIRPADSAQTYFYYPAPFDTVHVRPAPFREGMPPESQELPVEVLVKGSFPDSCTELQDLEQHRTGNIIEAHLRIRKPRGAICAAVVRPYRFYFMLTGEYRPGHYTLKLNDIYVPFQVTPPSN